MSRSLVFRLFLVGVFFPAILTGCSRDPSVRKQKFFESGDRYYDKGKYREAAIQYANALQVDSRFAQAHYKLGEAYLRLGDLNDGGRELSRAVELAPDNYRARLDLANLLISAQNPDGSNEEYLKQAREQLDVLREKEPQDPEVFQAWADYYAASNNLGAALLEMQKGIAANPNRAESYLELALLQSRSNLLDQAEASFKKAADVDPKGTNAHVLLGGFYQMHNRMPEAEQQFKRAIELAPKELSPARRWCASTCRRARRRKLKPCCGKPRTSFRITPKPIVCLAIFISPLVISIRPLRNTPLSMTNIPGIF